MNFLTIDNNKKKDHLHKMMKNIAQNRSLMIRSQQLSRSVLSESPHKLLYGEEMSDEFLNQKIFILKSKIESIDEKIICFSGDTESLIKKRDEMKAIILEYKKKIDELSYLKTLAEKKFSNIETIDFKARETQV